MKVKALDRKSMRWVYLTSQEAANNTDIMLNTICFESSIPGLYEDDLVSFKDDPLHDKYIVKIVKGLLMKHTQSVLVSQKNYNVTSLDLISADQLVIVANTHDEKRQYKW